MPPPTRHRRSASAAMRSAAAPAEPLTLEQVVLAHRRRTHNSRVLPSPPGVPARFLLDFPERLFQRNYRDPILLCWTQSLGSKLEMLHAAGRHEQIGRDLAAAMLNALAAQGAEPLWVQHSLLARHVGAGAVQAVLAGLAHGCREAHCAMLDGMTQELLTRADGTPGFELVAFAAGVCERHRLIDGRRLRAGDTLLGLVSSSVHPDAALDVLAQADIARPEVQQALLEPLPLIGPILLRILRSYQRKQVISAIIPLAAGGLETAAERLAQWSDPGSRPRLAAELDAEALPTPAFPGDASHGLAMLIAVRPAFAQSIARQLARRGHQAIVIGSLRRREPPVA